MRSALHLYVVQLDSSRTSIHRKDAFNSLRSAGIGVNVHYIPVYRQPYFSQFGFKFNDFPNCENYYAQCISLPCTPSLSDEDLKRLSRTSRVCLRDPLEAGLSITIIHMLLEPAIHTARLVSPQPFKWRHHARLLQLVKRPDNQPIFEARFTRHNIENLQNFVEAMNASPADLLMEFSSKVNTLAMSK